MTEKEKKVVELYKEGKYPTEISKSVGVGRRTVYRMLNRNGIEYHKKTERTCKICDKEITTKNVCGMCSVSIRRYRVREQAVNYLGGECSRCGWSGDLSGYDFHHLDPSEKTFPLTGVNMANKKWETVKEELDKCVLLCALCHRLEHSNYKNEKLITEAENYRGKLFK